MIELIKKIFFPIDDKAYYKLLFLFLLILVGAVLELLSISLLIPILTIFVGDDYLQFSKYLFFIDFESKIQFLSFVLILFLLIYFFKLMVATCLLYFQTTFLFSLYTKISRTIFKNYLKIIKERS